MRVSDCVIAEAGLKRISDMSWAGQSFIMLCDFAFAMLLGPEVRAA